MRKVTCIGLGIMGSRMATNLLKAGVALTVYNRSASKAQPLVDQGAVLATSLQSAVENADVVFTMLSTPLVVTETATAFLPHMNQGTLWVDCSTVSPQNSLDSKKLAERFGISFLEAPVAGTKQPAENGALVFFLGGNPKDQQSVGDLLAIMGKQSVDMGVVGNAAKIKLLVNLMLAQSMAAFSETVKLGMATGLTQETIHHILLATPVTAPFLQIVKGKLESHDTTPNFPMEWMTKDLNLISQTAQSVSLKMPLAETLTELFEQALSENQESEDFSSIYHWMND